jgi:hypothetical protein
VDGELVADDLLWPLEPTYIETGNLQCLSGEVAT